MKQTTDISDRTRRRGMLSGLVATMAMVFAVPASAGVTASPSDVIFNDVTQTATVHLRTDGNTVPAADVGAAKVYIGENDYDHMFDITRKDGAIHISPNEHTEIGSYRLVIPTDSGKATVNVYTPLSDLETSLETQARMAGMSVDALKHSLGLFTMTERDFVSLELPPIYYEGQNLMVAMDPPAARDFKWYVNGRMVESGQGPYTFTYAFTDPGVHTVRYEEWTDGKIVSTAYDTTQVVAEPPVQWRVSKNQEFSLQAPEGYARYTWFVNGAVVSNQRVLTHMFTRPGTYTVQSHAMDALTDDVPAHRKIVYEVSVPNVSS